MQLTVTLAANGVGDATAKIDSALTKAGAMYKLHKLAKVQGKEKYTAELEVYTNNGKFEMPRGWCAS